MAEHDDGYFPTSRNHEHYKKSNSYTYNPHSKTDHYYNNNEQDLASLSAKCAQILNEICAIAQVHPHVLETAMKTLIHLFPSPSDTTKQLLDQLKKLQNENSS